MPDEPSAERQLYTCLEAEREVVNASRFCFSGWDSWLTCKSFCCIISSNDEDLVGNLDGQGFSCACSGCRVVGQTSCGIGDSSMIKHILHVPAIWHNYS